MPRSPNSCRWRGGLPAIFRTSPAWTCRRSRFRPKKHWRQRPAISDLHTSASLYPAISERDILKLPIPNIGGHAAERIISHVRQAHAARQQAQALVEKAKRAVEIAIEEDEAAAREYLA